MTGHCPEHLALKRWDDGPIAQCSDSVHDLSDLKETLMGLRIHLLKLASVISFFIVKSFGGLWSVWIFPNTGSEMSDGLA